jgi:hypothetical protein
MKELDFDELDKAVNSLMGDVPKTDEPAKDDTNVTAAEPNASESSNEGSQPTPAATDPSIEASSPTLPSPASRRGGRFMDVVHPSSDMKTSRMAASSREGISITPPAPQTSIVSSPEQNTPVDEPVVPVEPAAEAPLSSEWPDPIALHEEKQADEPVESVPDTTSPAPLTSPFLSDAKVEKRPLGGQAPDLDQAIAKELGNTDTKQPTENTSTKVASLGSPLVEEKPTEAPAEELKPQLLAETDEKTPLPAELASDLVAIEAGGATASENPVSTSAPESIETPAAPVIGGGSIQQQYTEQPSTGDESHAAIYDTDAAQQPLLHPPKKKTGWLVTIWIVLIIILGVGVGATIWYFGLI